MRAAKCKDALGVSSGRASVVSVSFWLLAVGHWPLAVGCWLLAVVTTPCRGGPMCPPVPVKITTL